MRSLKKNPAAYHHGGLPEALKKASLKLIALHGVEGFSLRQAAAAVGVSPGAAYRHYKDKAALLAAVARDGLAALAQDFREVIQEAHAGAGSDTRRGALAAYEAVGLAYVRFALKDPNRFQVMFGRFGAGRPTTHEELSQRAESPYLLLGTVLDELRDCGVLSAAGRKDAEHTAWSSTHGLACLLAAGALRGVSEDNYEEVVRDVSRRTLSGLNARA
jgi:AcrR family transcriptional regulator